MENDFIFGFTYWKLYKNLISCGATDSILFLIRTTEILEVSSVF